MENEDETPLQSTFFRAIHIFFPYQRHVAHTFTGQPVDFPGQLDILMLNLASVAEKHLLSRGGLPGGDSTTDLSRRICVFLNCRPQRGGLAFSSRGREPSEAAIPKKKILVSTEFKVSNLYPAI